MISIKELTAKTFIIAEIGKNFIQTEEHKSVEEYLEKAKSLVKAAKESGADAVKFQTHHLEDEQLNINVISPHFKGSDRYNWIKRNDTSTPVDKFWAPLKEYCDQLGILFFTTPMSRGAAKKVNHLVDFWKVGSGDLLDFVTLDYLCSTKKPIIISSGMSTLEELDQTINFLKRRNADFALLHCVSKYPCPPEELHLNTIKFFQKRYNIPIGFSDHSIGFESSLTAVALGAKIIEKHFSFDRSFWGSDHKVSMTPKEFKSMTQEIRRLEENPKNNEELLKKETVQKGLGKEAKILQEGEAVFRQYFRKSLMTGLSLPKGTVLKPEHVYAMRPQAFAKGLPSEKYELVLGKKLTQDLNKHDPITFNVLE